MSMKMIKRLGQSLWFDDSYHEGMEQIQFLSSAVAGAFPCLPGGFNLLSFGFFRSDMT